MATPPLILVTNDDGIAAPGLFALIDAVRDLGDLIITAPDTERSGSSHAMTFHSMLRAHEVEPALLNLGGGFPGSYLEPAPAIEELAGRAGMTVRNVRNYQTKGLLPPPRLAGRKGVYSDEHLARLQLIKEMQAGGFNLTAIRKLLEGVPEGAGREALRFEQALLSPWSEDEPEIVEVAELAEYLRALITSPTPRPTALLVISAHWEQPIATVMTAEHPPMLYDYYGFPPKSYEITWPAPGAPDVASRVRELLTAAGIANAADHARGFDHGTFVPLKLTYPEADVPATQLSLRAGLDPAEHIALGRALMPLREEDIFIIASGMTFHNLRAFRDPRAAPVAEQFDEWLRASMTLDAESRNARLTEWESAPAARAARSVPGGRRWAR